MKTTLAFLACLGAATAFVPSAPLSGASTMIRARGSSVSMMAEKSKSIPFLPRPEALDGTVAGDVGK